MTPHDYPWALECWREMMAKYKAGRPSKTKAAKHDRETLEALDYAHQSEEALLIRAHAAEDLAAELVEACRKALNYIANSEGEFGITLESGDALRDAIAKAEGRA
jgi:hypothetical protein